VLDVFANVEIDFETGRGWLVAQGQHFVLDVDEPSTLIGVVERRSLRALAERLTRAGFTLRVRSGDRLLLLAGRDAKTGILTRLLRLPGVQLSPRFALRSALGRGHPRS
jgi:predicted transcriptional regulator of viral defense system